MNINLNEWISPRINGTAPVPENGQVLKGTTPRKDENSISRFNIHNFLCSIPSLSPNANINIISNSCAAGFWKYFLPARHSELDRQVGSSNWVLAACASYGVEGEKPRHIIIIIIGIRFGIVVVVEASVRYFMANKKCIYYFGGWLDHLAGGGCCCKHPLFPSPHPLENSQHIVCGEWLNK